MDCSFLKNVVSSHICDGVCKQMFITRVIQFECTHRSSYETTSFEKEQSIA